MASDAEYDRVRQQLDELQRQLSDLTDDRSERFNVVNGLSAAGTEALPEEVSQYLPSIFVKDSAGRYEGINAAAALRLGLSHNPAVALNKTDFEFFAEEYANFSHHMDAEVMENELPTLDYVEIQASLTNQDKTWMLTSRFPRRDSKGKITGVVVVSRDITVAEQRSRSSLAEFQAVGDSTFGDSATPLDTLARSCRAVAGANDGMWDRDLTTGRLCVSKRWKEMLGIEGDVDLVFEDLVEMIHPDDRQKVKQINSDHLEGKSERYECEFRIRHNDGGYRWIHSRGQVTRDGNGKPVFFSGSHTDITDRIQAQEEVRSKEQFIERLVDTDRSMIFVKDASHRFTFVNEPLAKFHGKSKEEVLGKTDHELCATDEQVERFLKCDREVLAGHEMRPMIEDIRGADGKTYWFHTTKVPFEVDGEAHVLGVAIDITTWHTEREKREQQRDELRTIMRLTPIALHLKDAEGRYTQVNEAFLRKASKSSFDDVIGKTVDDVFDSEIADKVKMSDAEILNGVPEVQAIMKIGERYYDVLKLPRHDANRRVIGILGVSRDITEETNA